MWIRLPLTPLEDYILLSAALRALGHSMGARNVNKILSDFIRLVDASDTLVNMTVDAATYDRFVDYTHLLAKTKFQKDLMVKARTTGEVCTNQLVLKRGAEIRNPDIVPISEGRKLDFSLARSLQRGDK